MAYQKTTIRHFKGLSQNLALTSGSPEYALDCVNVIPSVAGLAKLRIPTQLSFPPNGTTQGPDQFGMFSGVVKEVLVFFGAQIWIFHLDSFSGELFDTKPDYLGPVPWSVTMANDFAFLQNGLSVPLKYTGTGSTSLEYWGIQKGQTPTLGALTGTGFTVSIGRKYRVAYKNGTTEHVGTASDASVSTGPVSNQTQPVVIPAPTTDDRQIDTVRLYATLDGGEDYFFHSEHAAPSFPLTINDNLPDTSLDQSERAPLINDQPPKAKFTCQWGGRIFMFNLVDESKKWVAYTGYNRIFVGRPEETCPPGNRIKIDVGADEISGGGVIEAGVIVFDNSNKMFMFRGQPEDITIDAPVEYSLFLKQLPFTIGCGSHFSIQSTPYGLVWLSPSLDVFVYNGADAPRSIADGVEPILRSVTMSQIQNARSAYWQYKGRDWYVLGVPTTLSPDLTKLLIFDMEPNPEANVGCFPFDVGTFQSIGIVEMLNGEQKLVIGQGGSLKELTVTATTQNGLEQNATSTTGTLGAFYMEGYRGNENPEAEKFVRWGRVTTDSNGIRVKTRLIRNDPTKPEIVEFRPLNLDGKFSTNKKARFWSHEYRFDDLDVAQNILQVVDVAIPIAER